MTKKTLITGLCILSIGLIYGFEKKSLPSSSAPKKPRLSLFDRRRKKNKQMIPFSFEKKSLIDIIDQLAEKKHVNIILPQLTSDLEIIKKQTVTFQPQGRENISIDEAWKLLSTFLELSGFAISAKKNDLYAIVRIGKADEAGINREILPLFVNTPYDDLPNKEERIRYIYYLKNLKTPTQEDRETNPIARILKDTLSPGAPVVYEPKSNGFIIVDKAHVVASAMRIISELDHSGFKETIEVIQLHNIAARDVLKIFDSLKRAAGTPQGVTPFIRSDARSESLNYFAADTKMVADHRHNTLIIMGRQSAVERIASFIESSIDVPPESGQSILHHYDLQYLDAQTFAQVLTKIVAPPSVGLQATAGGIGGPERHFQGVVVMAEEVKAVEIKTTTEEISLEAAGGYIPTGIGAQQIITGGNRLIIAAIQDDWLRLKDFIESVDKAQPQVILEVMIVDVRAIKAKSVAGTIRNKTDAQLPFGVEWVSNNISNANSVLGNQPDKLAEDLLNVLAVDPNNTPVTSLLAPGSLIVSFNDPKTPGIFGLLAVLDQALDTKVLSHPYLITTNNQKATIASQELRRVRGDAVPGAAGVVTIQFIDLPATIQVQMIPRLSSLERLSLQIAVDINDFVDPISLTRLTRRVNTNVNLGSGQILVIGGLSRSDEIDGNAGTPFFSNIPIFGAFFRRTSKAVTRNNLAIFISPTIVQPKLRGGLNVYTADKIRKSRRDIEENAIFNELRDPITHLFFREQATTDKVLKDYLSNVINPPDAELIKTAREKRRKKFAPVKQPTKEPKKAPRKTGLLGELPA